MTNEVKNRNNFADALAMDIRYAVLTKAGRIQILVKPKPKQLRKRGKRGWHLFSTVESKPDAGQLLHEAVGRALAEIEHPPEPAAIKKPKMKNLKQAATAAE